MAWALGYALSRRGMDEQLLALTGQTLAERVLPPLWSARLHALLAQALEHADRFEEAAATAAQARAEGEQAGDPYSIGYALHVLAVLEVHHHSNLPAALDRVDDALIAVGGLGPDTAELRMVLLGNRVVGLDTLGRRAEADRAVAEMLLAAERLGHPVALAVARQAAGAGILQPGAVGRRAGRAECRRRATALPRCPVDRARLSDTDCGLSR